MKRVITIQVFMFLTMMFLIHTGCKEDNPVVNLPEVSTDLITEITTTGALCGGGVISDGGGEITARGVCWGPNPAPQADKNKTTNGTGIGNFTSTIEGLAPNTFVYVRAYATNSAGTAYGEEMVLKTYTSTVTDIDGNVYYTVTIMGLELMASNLKTTKFNDGTAIPHVTDNSDWSTLSTPAYCWYENDFANYGSVYGGLYNWFAASHEKLCPVGWRVPDDQNYLALESFVAPKGGDLKATGIDHWEIPNEGATNATGFTAFGSGRRNSHDGSFSDLWIYANWWTRTEDASYSAFQLGCRYNSQGINTVSINKKIGLSVRCMKN